MSGVAQIILFNKEMKPLSERLYYINADKHLKFNIKTENDVFNPGQETRIGGVSYRRTREILQKNLLYSRC